MRKKAEHKEEQIRINIAYNKSFVDRVKKLADERQICYQSFLRMLAAERLLEIEQEENIRKQVIFAHNLPSKLVGD